MNDSIKVQTENLPDPDVMLELRFRAERRGQTYRLGARLMKDNPKDWLQNLHGFADSIELFYKGYSANSAGKLEKEEG